MSERAGMSLFSWAVILLMAVLMLAYHVGARQRLDTLGRRQAALVQQIRTNEGVLAAQGERIEALEKREEREL